MLTRGYADKAFVLREDAQYDNGGKTVWEAAASLLVEQGVPRIY